MKTFIENPTINENWGDLPDVGCSVFTVINTTGVTVNLRRAAEPTKTMSLVDGASVDINAANCSEWEAQRDSGTGNLTLELMID